MVFPKIFINFWNIAVGFILKNVVQILTNRKVRLFKAYQVLNKLFNSISLVLNMSTATR